MLSGKFSSIKRLELRDLCRAGGSSSFADPGYGNKPALQKVKPHSLSNHTLITGNWSEFETQAFVCITVMLL